jgi:hypothetical protein
MSLQGHSRGGASSQQQQQQQQYTCQQLVALDANRSRVLLLLALAPGHTYTTLQVLQLPVVAEPTSSRQHSGLLWRIREPRAALTEVQQQVLTADIPAEQTAAAAATAGGWLHTVESKHPGCASGCGWITSCSASSSICEPEHKPQCSKRHSSSQGATAGHAVNL